MKKTTAYKKNIVLLTVMTLSVLLTGFYIFYLSEKKLFDYLFGLLWFLSFSFLWIFSVKKVIAHIKKMAMAKEILEDWFSEHPDQEKKSHLTGEGIFQSGPTKIQISPKDVIEAVREENNIGLRYLEACVNLINKGYDLEDLLANKENQARKILEEWFKNHPEKDKAIIMRGRDELSPRDIIKEIREETKEGREFINSTISLLNKGFDLKKLTKKRDPCPCTPDIEETWG